MSSSLVTDVNLANLRRVLVVKPSSLGDIVHALPVVHDLKMAHPHLEIAWIANSEWLPLLRQHPHLSKTIEFPRQKFRGLRGLGAIGWLLRLHQIFRADVVLDLQGLFRSGLISWLSYGRKRIGMRDAREGARHFYHYVIEVPTNVHAVDRYRTVVQALGVNTEEPAVFTLPPGESGPYQIPTNYVALHPFSRGDGKSMTPAQVEAFCEQAKQPVVVLGRCEPSVTRDLRLPSNCTNLLNATSIPQLIYCLRKARLVISVDSGPMHLAAALKPEAVLSIHTWSDPRKVGPYAPDAWVWKAGQIQQRHVMLPEVCTQNQTFTGKDVGSLLDWVHDRS